MCHRLIGRTRKWLCSGCQCIPCHFREISCCGCADPGFIGEEDFKVRIRRMIRNSTRTTQRCGCPEGTSRNKICGILWERLQDSPERISESGWAAFLGRVVSAGQASSPKFCPRQGDSPKMSTSQYQEKTAGKAEHCQVCEGKRKPG